MSSGSFVVAIDGHAGSGKSTVSRMLAKALGWMHIDTGAMYRAITLKALKLGLPLDDERALTDIALSTKIEFVTSSTGEQRILVDGEDVTEEIRSPEVETAVSYVSAIRGVRRALQAMQRELVKGRCAVAEGRDMQTVVFPDAQLKVFLTASLEERARRRYLELKAKGYDVSFEDVLKRTQERDRLDSTRDDSPLMPAEDAIIIDTTHMSPEEVVQQILSALRQRTEGDESNTACGFKQ